MNYYKLELPVKFLQDSAPFPASAGNKWNMYEGKTSNFITRQCIDFFLDTLKVQIKDSVRLFLGEPNSSCGIHLDGFVHPLTGKNNVMPYAINYIINGEHSVMNWYKVIKDSNIIRIASQGNANKGYLDHHVELVEQAQLSGLYLVRTDVPHNVVNHSEKIRYCVSAGLCDFPNTWDQAVKFFQSYIR